MNGCNTPEPVFCYVCGGRTKYDEDNNISSISKYQKITIKSLLTQVLSLTDDSLEKTRDATSQVLCWECKEQIDLYDYGVWITQKTEKELQRVYRSNDQLKLTPNQTVLIEENEVYEEEYLEEYLEEVAAYDEIETEDHNLTEAVDQPQNDGSLKNGELETKTKPKDLKCRLCFLKLPNAEELNKHIQSHKGLSSPLQCPICYKIYTSKGILVRHMPLHFNAKNYVCSKCGKAFVHFGSFNAHQAVHRDEVKVYACNICGKEFAYYGSYRTHKLAHENKKDKKCPVCGLAFIRKSHLERHIRGKHTGEKRYKCHCGARFAEKYNLVTHQKMHEGVTKKMNGLQ